MFYVRIKHPIAGVRSQLFVFSSEAEMSEFASCLHARYHAIETEEGQTGEPTEIFEGWSF